MECMYRDCDESGRLVGRLGVSLGSPLLLVYCPKHRKFGEKTIDFLVNSVYDDKVAKFLKDERSSLFNECEVNFCDSCASKLHGYIKDNVYKLGELELASFEMFK